MRVTVGMIVSCMAVRITSQNTDITLAISRCITIERHSPRILMRTWHAMHFTIQSMTQIQMRGSIKKYAGIVNIKSAYQT